MVGSIEQQVDMWLKSELQTKFSSVNWDNRAEFLQVLKENGYFMELHAMNKYVLFHNGEQVSEFQVQVNFSNGKKRKDGIN